MSALVDAAEDVMSVVPRAYKVNEVPASPVLPYVVWSLTGERPDAYTLDATHGLRTYRITWQAFGKTLDAASAFDDLATDAFLDKRLPATGYDCGPAQIQVGQAVSRDPDDKGVVSLTTTLTFAATKE